jgi:hypothetical protein
MNRPLELTHPFGSTRSAYSNSRYCLPRGNVLRFAPAGSLIGQEKGFVETP